MFGLEQVELIITILEDLKDDVKKSYPEIEEKVWFQDVEKLLDTANRIKSALSIIS